MRISERPTRVRQTIFVLACAVSWLLYVHRYSWGVVKPYFRAEYPEISDRQIGWLDSAFQGSYALAQVPVGMAADVFGPRVVLSGLVPLWSAAVAWFAYASGLWGLFAARIACGAAQAGCYPILNKLSRSWFPLSSRTSVQGAITAMGRIGGASCSVIVATVLMKGLGLSWRSALFAIAAPGAVLGLVFWRLARDTPREHRKCDPAELELIEAGTVPSSTSSASGTPTKWRLDRRSLLNLGMMLIYSFASTFQDQLYVYWIPSFLVEGKGLDAGAMGLLTPLPLIGGAIGGIAGGFLNDYLIRRRASRRCARSGTAFAGKFLAAILVLSSLWTGDGRVAMLILLAARFFGDWSLSTLWGAVTDVSGRKAATVFGLVNSVGAFGGFAANPILGELKTRYGWEGLFVAASAMCLLSAVTWLFIDCERRIEAD